MKSLRRFMPSPETLRGNRWLRWLGPALFNPRLWSFSRRSIALGMALGVFFGLLIPIAQIPFSAAAAVVLRANVPAAVASTLVTNPVTFGPVYYAAWQLGRTVLGEPDPAANGPAGPAGPAGSAGPAGQAGSTTGEPTTAGPTTAGPTTSGPTTAGPALDPDAEAPWWQRVASFASGVGKPLVVGLAILAVAVGLLTYFAVSWVWAFKVWWQRRRRLRLATARPGTGDA